MRQLQVTAPRKNRKKVKDILEEHSSDVSSSSAEKNDKPVTEFTATVESDNIDDLTQELKDIKEIESGDLSIRVLDQASLIRKGSPVKGSSTVLSQAELYSQAQESSSFNPAQWGLIALSAVIAAFGLAADNVIVVIGAMMVAPILSPFISGALSLAVGDRKLLASSSKTGVLSILLAVAAAYVAMLPFPVSFNPTLALVSSPSIVSVLLALFVGAAAALTFATGLRDEIAGVAVAIALIPPIASVGIGLKMADLSLAVNAGTVALMNVLSVIVAGFASFKLLGITPSTYYRKKQAEELSYVVPVAMTVFLLLAIPVAYSSYQGFQDYASSENIHSTAQDVFGDQLLKIDEKEGKTVIYVVGNVDEQRLFDRISPAEPVKVVELAKIN